MEVNSVSGAMEMFAPLEERKNGRRGRLIHVSRRFPNLLLFIDDDDIV